MLIKLYKHEIISTSRSMLPLYAAMLVIAGAGRLLNALGGSKPASAMEIALNLGEMINVIILYIAVLLTFIVILQRFSKSLLGDNAYVYMSLPVKPRAHVFTKLTCSVLWSAATYGMIQLTYLIYRGEAAYPLSYIFVEGNSFWLNFMSVAVLLLTAALIASGVYLTLSLAHLFKKHRVVAAIIIGVALAVSFWVVSDLILTAQPLSHIIPDRVYDFLSEYGILFSLYMLAHIIAAHEITVFILTKRLNLE